MHVSRQADMHSDPTTGMHKTCQVLRQNVMTARTATTAEPWTVRFAAQKPDYLSSDCRSHVANTSTPSRRKTYTASFFLTKQPGSFGPGKQPHCPFGPDEQSRAFRAYPKSHCFFGVDEQPHCPVGLTHNHTAPLVSTNSHAARNTFTVLFWS